MYPHALRLAGNVRELRNAMERASLLSRGGMVLPTICPRASTARLNGLWSSEPAERGAWKKSNTKHGRRLNNTASPHRTAKASHQPPHPRLQIATPPRSGFEWTLHKPL